MSQGGVVLVTTKLWAAWYGLQISVGLRYFPFPKLSIPALVPTQLSIRWVTELFSGVGQLEPRVCLYYWELGTYVHKSFNFAIVDLNFCHPSCSGPGSSVGIATELRPGRFSNRSPVGSRFTAALQTGPGAQPASCTMGTGSFPGLKIGRGVTLTSHPLLVPWSRKGRAKPLLPLWAVRLVRSFSACTNVHFTFTLPALLQWSHQ
jgi:hypothetical protein